MLCKLFNVYSCTIINCNILAMIDLQQLDPDWQFAQRHGKSTLPGKVSGQMFQNAQRCPCCLRIIDKSQLSISQNAKELQCLGFGFPLYYIFIKYSIILVFIQVVTYNAIALYWSYEQNIPFCQDHEPIDLPNGQIIEECTGFLVSIARIQIIVDTPELIARICSFVAQMLALIYIRDKIRKTNSYYDERNTSLGDYSVIMKEIPPCIGVQAKIRNLFSTYFKKQVVIQQLILISHLEEYYQLEHHRQQLVKQKSKLLEAKIADEVKIEQKNQQIAKVEENLQEAIQKQIKLAQKDCLVCEKAIVVLSSDPDKQYVLDKFQSIDKNRIVSLFGDQNARKIRIVQAPQPSQIIWKNINIERKKRYLRVFLAWLFTIIFIAGITTVFYFILNQKSILVQKLIAQQKGHNGGSHLQQDPPATASEQNMQNAILAITYITLILIILFNKFIVPPFLHLICHFQKNSTQDKQEYSFALKYTLTLFFTTALMTLLVEDFTLNNIYKEEYGVIQEQSIMFFFNALFVPLLWLINPWHLFRLIQRKLKRGKKTLTQAQANILMQNPQVSLGKLYGEVLQTLWFTYLYAAVIPLGAIVTLFGLILHYWVDKINLIKRSSLENQVSGNMSQKALKLLDITLIMRPIGCIIFDIQIRQGVSIEAIVTASIALLYLITPMNKVLQKLHREQFNLQEKGYKDVKDTFILNYKNLHPIISHKKLIINEDQGKIKLSNFSSTVKKKNEQKNISLNGFYKLFIKSYLNKR